MGAMGMITALASKGFGAARGASGRVTGALKKHFLNDSVQGASWSSINKTEALKSHFLNDPTKNLSWDNLNKGAALGLGTSGYFALNDYSAQRDEGSGVISSAATAAGSLILGYALPWYVYMGLQVAAAAPGIAVDTYDALSQKSRQLQRSARNVPFQNATFLDSQQTYTMRQAGMHIAKQGKYAAQAAMLGNEAQSVSMAHQGRR